MKTIWVKHAREQAEKSFMKKRPVFHGGAPQGNRGAALDLEEWERLAFSKNTCLEKESVLSKVIILGKAKVELKWRGLKQVKQEY